MIIEDDECSTAGPYCPPQYYRPLERDLSYLLNAASCIYVTGALRKRNVTCLGASPILEISIPPEEIPPNDSALLKPPKPPPRPPTLVFSIPPNDSLNPKEKTPSSESRRALPIERRELPLLQESSAPCPKPLEPLLPEQKKQVEELLTLLAQGNLTNPFTTFTVNRLGGKTKEIHPFRFLESIPKGALQTFFQSEKPLKPLARKHFLEGIQSSITACLSSKQIEKHHITTFSENMKKEESKVNEFIKDSDFKGLIHYLFDIPDREEHKG